MVLAVSRPRSLSFFGFFRKNWPIFLTFLNIFLYIFLFSLFLVKISLEIHKILAIVKISILSFLALFCCLKFFQSSKTEPGFLPNDNALNFIYAKSSKMKEHENLAPVCVVQTPYTISTTGDTLKNGQSDSERDEYDKILDLLGEDYKRSLNFENVSNLVKFDRPFAIEVNRNQSIVNLKFCMTCRIYRIAGSSHCSRCGFCVDMHDHHCDVLNICVGLRNRRHFFLLVFCFFLLSFFAQIDYVLTNAQILAKDRNIAHLVTFFIALSCLLTNYVCIFVFHSHINNCLSDVFFYVAILCYLALFSCSIFLFCVGLVPLGVSAFGLLESLCASFLFVPMFLQQCALLRNGQTMKGKNREKTEGKNQSKGLTFFEMFFYVIWGFSNEGRPSYFLKELRDLIYLNGADIEETEDDF